MSPASDEAASSSQAGLPLGSVIADKYRIDGVLGAGGMGVVLSATNLDLDAPVAIKVVREEFLSNEDVVSRMVQEARSAAKMHGAHSVRVFDVARLDSGAPYIVMECLTGRDLATYLAERGALPVQEAVSYLLQACEGLAEAHALGIIHRDLKPENLFLAETPEGPVLKILDFGISKDTGRSGRGGPRVELTHAGCAVGSPYYMSPEQMRASPDVDERTDIWSLGAVLFELLTGRCPFDGESVQVVCGNVLNCDPPSLSGFSAQAPEELDKIVRRCLEKDPNRRYASVGELSAALRSFAESETGRAADRRLASGISLIPKAASDGGGPRVSLSSATLPSLADTGSAPALPAPALLAAQPPAPRRRRWPIAAGLVVVAAAGAALFISQRPAALGQTLRLLAGQREAAAPQVAAAVQTVPTAQAASAVSVGPTLVSTRAASEPPTERTALARPPLAARGALAAAKNRHAWKGARGKNENALLPFEAPELPSTATPLPAVTPPPDPTPSAAAPSASATAAAPPPSAQRAPVDAWSPDSLGGRY
jgi:serine/threonine-protein kinase